MDVEPVEAPGRRLVAEPLQGGADQRGAAVAVVDEAEFGLEFEAVVLDPLSEGLELAGDRVALDLTVGRDAAIDRRPDFMVAHRYVPSIAFRTTSGAPRGFRPASGPGWAVKRCRMMGMTHS